MNPTTPSDASLERAERICEFARAKASAGVFEGAFVLYVQALQSAPGSEVALKGLLDAGTKLGEQSASSPAIRTLRKEFAQAKSGTGDLLDSLVVTALWPNRKDAALIASDRAFRGGFESAGQYLAERALALLSNAESQSSADYFALAKSAFDHRFYDVAERAAQAALDLDPTSLEKRSFHKNVSAARIIDERKLDKPETTFRSNLRNAAAQQELAAKERPVSSTEELERFIAAARAEVAASANDKGKIFRLVTLLEKRGQSDDLQEAVEILTTEFERSGDVSFRQKLGELQLRELESKAKAAQRAAALQPNQVDLANQADEARLVYLQAKCAEFEKRAMEYPTEASIRLELGDTLLSLQRFNEAIPHLQAGRGDMKQRARAWRLLGSAFTAIGFWDEAALCLEEAVKHAEQTGSQQLDAKVSLGNALFELYQKRPDPSYIERARHIVMEVVVEDFTHPGALRLRSLLAKAMQSKP